MNLDVTDEQSIAASLSLGGTAIDIFINNAGVYGPRDANFGKVKSADWESVLKVNAISPCCSPSKSSAICAQVVPEAGLCHVQNGVH